MSSYTNGNAGDLVVDVDGDVAIARQMARGIDLLGISAADAIALQSRLLGGAATGEDLETIAKFARIGEFADARLSILPQPPVYQSRFEVRDRTGRVRLAVRGADRGQPVYRDVDTNAVVDTDERPT